MRAALIQGSPPPQLLAELEKRLKYTDAIEVLYCIPLGVSDVYCGVFGDGDASYEWFVWKHGLLDTSNDAYGMAEIALREALMRALPPDS